MKFTQLTQADVKHMLDAIGVAGFEELTADIPAGARLDRPLDVPQDLSEQALLNTLEGLASANRTCHEQVCFLGGGIYDHFVPSVVGDLASQSEFVTAYTPYQAESAQGALQALYEYQTLICQLTGMDVSNASLYEGATAAAEAVLMARGINGRRKVVVSSGVHPETREVLSTYLRALPIEIVTVETPDGTTRLHDFVSVVDNDTSAVLIQSPNVFGSVESLAELVDAARSEGAVTIASVDPISCGLLKTPGELGADVVVGDAQSLGIPMNYGGPTIGFMACREQLMRKIPGRLIGATRDRSDRRAFCLTLQTREQHIRRERATSNICTNQGLLAIQVAVYLSAVGPTGLRQIARACLDNAQYAARQIANLSEYSLRFDAPLFKEFVVRTTKPVDRVLDACHARGILAGIPLGRWYHDLSDCFLVAVTEKRTRDEIDRLVQALDEA